MAKLNSIGVRAKDVDRIIDKAIRCIGLGQEVFSCCALIVGGKENNTLSWKVRKAYTRTLGPLTIYPDHYGYAFSVEVRKATNKGNKANFRVLLLSLFKAAWRDLV